MRQLLNTIIDGSIFRDLESMVKEIVFHIKKGMMTVILPLLWPTSRGIMMLSYQDFLH